MSLGVTGICRVFRSRPWICLNFPLQTTTRSGVGGGYVLSMAQGDVLRGVSDKGMVRRMEMWSLAKL